MPDFSGLAATTPHTILLSGDPHFPQQALAAASITPGHLVEIVSGGGIRRHGTSDGNALPAFALENVTPDRSVATQSIDTPYAAGETVKWMIAEPGVLVYGWVPANATAIVAGDFLASNGDGSLHKAVTGTTFVECLVGQAAEAVNNSAGGTPARIRVRAL